MSKQQLGSDNWLHVLSNAIANYAAEGGAVRVAGGENAVIVYLDGVTVGDGRLHPDFLQLAAAPATTLTEAMKQTEHA